jgi:hypothetical protein
MTAGHTKRLNTEIRVDLTVRDSRTPYGRNTLMRILTDEPILQRAERTAPNPVEPGNKVSHSRVLRVS